MAPHYCTGSDSLPFEKQQGDAAVKDQRTLPARLQPQAHKGISGPKFFLMGLLESDKDASDEWQEGGPDNASQTKRDASCSSSPIAKDEKAHIRVASWNLAGVSAKDIETVFAHVVDCDVVAVQEFPKQEAGWKITTGNRFHGK